MCVGVGGWGVEAWGRGAGCVEGCQCTCGLMYSVDYIDLLVCVEGCQCTCGLMYSVDYSDLLVCVHIAVLFLDRTGAL